SGNYRLRLIQVPGTNAVPAGDDGGPLANGSNQPGTIDLGDLDPWTIAATVGDRIVLQIDKTTGGAGFAPFMELFGPDGARVAFDSGSAVARVDVQAPVSGSYTVLISDVNATGAGGYELHLAQVPESFTVPANDEGGPLPDGTPKD